MPTKTKVRFQLSAKAEQEALGESRSNAEAAGMAIASCTGSSN